MSDYGEQPRERRLRGPRDENGVAHADSDPRETEQLPPLNNDWSAQKPVNPDWRRERATTTPRGQRKRIAGAPAGSPQEIQLWLQKGGWIYVAGAAVLVVVLLIALLALNRGARRTEPILGQAPTAPIATQGAAISLLPTATSEPPTTAASSAAYIVVNTGDLGLLLRQGPGRDNPAIETLPDGTRVEGLGEEVSGADFRWRRVRSPSGLEGWVAADFLQPAP